MQYVVRSPDTLMEELDNFVDGERFKSRNQLINLVLADWIAREKHPPDPYAQVFCDADTPGTMAYYFLRDERNHTRVALLEDNWGQYQNQKVDMLDGTYAERQIFEEMERIAKLETRYRELVEKGIQEAEERLEAKFAELLANVREVIPQLKESPNGSKSRKRKTADTKGSGGAGER